MIRLRLYILLLVAGLATVAAQAQEPTIHAPEEYVSGTMPVMYVYTEGQQPIVSKDVFVDGYYWIDPMGIEGVEAIGSPDEPLPLIIRGRGNITWRNYEKKAYRIKLVKKAALLGMRKSKSFVLMADAWDWMGCSVEQMGFEISRRLGLSWTPERRPVELVLNGDYVGLYFLTEKISVDKHRVNVVEQDNFETDPDLVTGGWLLEIDNTWDSQQLTVQETEDSRIRFTYHSPDSLSNVQRNYIRTFLNAANTAIYAPRKNSTEWERYIDLDSLVLYYLVCEITDRGESFSGSCYMHKERGDDTKLIFGPVWDFGSTWSHRRSGGIDSLLYYENCRFPTHWISEIVKFPRFQQRVHEIWQEFYYDELFTDLATYCRQWAQHIAAAGEADHRRWPQYKFDNAVASSGSYTTLLRKRLNFLNSRFGTPYEIPDTIALAMVETYGNVGETYTINDPLLIYSDKLGPLLLTDGQGHWLQVTDSLFTAENKLVGLCFAPGSLHGRLQNVDYDVLFVPDSMPALAADAAVGVKVEQRYIDDNIAWKANQVFDVTGYLTVVDGQHYLIPADTVVDERALPLYPDPCLDDAAVGEYYMMRLATQCVDGKRIYHPLNAALYRGDVNADGHIDGIDLNILINIVLGKDNAANYLRRADVDANDEIDGNDLNALINKLLGAQRQAANRSASLQSDDR